VLARRQADGTRMFSKRDNPLHVAAFLRDGGIVGILADQRVGPKGELTEFYGRLTRASPLPSLLARRAKSEVLALSMTTIEPGKWKAEFLPVDEPRTTPSCMVALEKAMKRGPVDVFWFQERWKVYVDSTYPLRNWLGKDLSTGAKKHRALLWLAGVSSSWRIPEEWQHEDMIYEIADVSDAAPPSWLATDSIMHTVTANVGRSELSEVIAGIDQSSALPIDYILTIGASPALTKAAARESIPLVSLPPA
jgi:KDO2-lipid IV(A) lauroyltransferase